MAEGNVEVVLQAFARLDAEDFDSGPRHWHPDSRATAPPGWPEPGPFEGWEAIRHQFERIASDLGEHGFREITVVADREGWVVLSYIWGLRGTGSGAAFASKMAAACQVTDGRIKVAHFRWTPDEALAAAGLAA